VRDRERKGNPSAFALSFALSFCLSLSHMLSPRARAHDVNIGGGNIGRYRWAPTSMRLYQLLAVTYQQVSADAAET